MQSYPNKNLMLNQTVSLVDILYLLNILIAFLLKKRYFKGMLIISYKNLAFDQDNNYVMSLGIHITCLLYNVSLLVVKGLNTGR